MIFCVEDEANIRELVVYTLETTGFEARGFEEGTSFFGSSGRGTARAEFCLISCSREKMDGDPEEAEDFRENQRYSGHHGYGKGCRI